MPRTSVKPTTAGNLESKFDAGEDVLDYFDLRTARVVPPMEAPAKFGNVAATVPTPSLDELKRAVRIAERIQKLENKLRSTLGKRGPRDKEAPAHMVYVKSAAKRARQNAVASEENKRVTTLVKNQRRLIRITVGKESEALARLRKISSALEKAAKAGRIHQNKAQRHKGDLARQLAALK